MDQLVNLLEELVSQRRSDEVRRKVGKLDRQMVENILVALVTHTNRLATRLDHLEVENKSLRGLVDRLERIVVGSRRES